MRKFLVGLVWGTLFTGAGLGAASYLVPGRVKLPAAPAATNAAQVAEPVAAQPEAPAPATTAPAETAAPETAAVESSPVPAAQAEPAPAAATAQPDAANQTAAAQAPAPAQPASDPAKTEAAPAGAATEPAQAKTEAAPDAASPIAAAAPAAAANLPPLQAFAAPFASASGKPPFAVVLIDIGHPEVDRAVAASLPLPVSFAVDPEAPYAAEAMALYRAAGKEVIMLPASLPAGATAADVEQSLAAYAQMLPESVAVMSLPEGGFQDDRALSGLVVPAIGAQGRGLVVLDKGLNSAAQIAQREGIAYVTIAKEFDGAGESVPVMRRYLDRAVFKAAQDGAGAVMGTLQPDTLAALTEWSIEGRAGDVALAPISALMAP